MYNDNNFTCVNCKCKFSTEKLYKYFKHSGTYYIDYKAKFLSLVINIFPTKVLQLESFVVTMLFWVYLFKSHPLLTS